MLARLRSFVLPLTAAGVIPALLAERWDFDGFVASEEPGLLKRFGDEYAEYEKHVPRWIPKLRPWHPS